MAPEETGRKGIPPPKRGTEFAALIAAAVIAVLTLAFVAYSGAFSTAPVDNEGERATETNAPSETAEPRANVTEGDQPRQ